MEEKMIEVPKRGKVSMDTIIQALDEKFGKSKPEFKPRDIHYGCFVVGVYGKYVLIETGKSYQHGCQQLPHQVDRFIQALQDAKAFVERNK